MSPRIRNNSARAARRGKIMSPRIRNKKRRAPAIAPTLVLAMGKCVLSMDKCVLSMGK